MNLWRMISDGLGEEGELAETLADTPGRYDFN